MNENAYEEYVKSKQSENAVPSDQRAIRILSLPGRTFPKSAFL